MLIMYLNLFNDVAHTTIAPTIGYAPVPGQLPQLGGGSIGMSRYSKKKKQVEQFFHWLYSDEISRHLVLLGATAPGLEYVTIKMFSISTRGLIY
jgi:ABC-type glycerol-3-phosphate transport system substrate-binding protein